MIEERSLPVLLVDDDRATLLTMQYVLEPFFRVECASSGAEALARIASVDVAVLLTDQRMPAMTGVDLCETVRERHPDVVRILITAYGDVHTAIEAVNRGGVTQFLLKPVRNDELLEIVLSATQLVQASRSVRSLQQRFLQESARAPARVVSRHAADGLATHLAGLREISSHLTDLSETSARRFTELQEEVRSTGADLASALNALEAFQASLLAGMPTSPPLRPVDLSRVIDTAARLVRPLAQATCQIVIALGASPRVLMGADELSHVVVQFLMFASRVASDGDVHVEVSETAGRAIVQADLRIEDEGAARALDPSLALDHPNAGLALARHLVEEANGLMRLEVTSGQLRLALELVAVPS